MVGARGEAGPKLRRKRDSGDGAAREGGPRQRWMDSVHRDMRAIGTTKDEVHDRTGCRIVVGAARRRS